MYDYKYKNFSIMRRIDCPNCGFFSFYIVHLGCINKYLSLGYTPIIDLKTFPNIYNKGNLSLNNPWELFFYQPFNYTLDEVQKYSKNIYYFNCTAKLYRPNEINIYYNDKSLNFWHNFAKQYMPLKNEIIKECHIIMNNLFGKSKNILGVRIRGTDYITKRPKGHSIPPKIDQVIHDVKIMDKTYKYDFIFFATEDEILKKKFISVSEFQPKLKLLNPKITLNYNYNNNYSTNINYGIRGEIEYIKNYVLNILILSKCLDLVTARCSGATGIYILSNGFRNTKVYYNGQY